LCYQSYIIKASADGSKAEWSTFLGGSGATYISQIAVDSHGNVWAAGLTNSPDMPVTPDAIRSEPALPMHGSYAGFIAALSPDGRKLVYGSYLDISESPDSLLIDSQDVAYIAGRTLYPNTFAASVGAYRSVPTPDTPECFAVKFDTNTRRVLYATLLGPLGSFDYGEPYPCCQIALDPSGDLYFAAAGHMHQSGFPVTPGAYSHPGQNSDIVVAALNPTGTGVLFSTVIGGGGNDYVRGIALDLEGNLFLAGMTSDLPQPNPPVRPSTDFPITADAMQSKFGPVFLLRLSHDGSRLEYSTFLGTSATLGSDHWLTPLSIQFGPDGKLRMLTTSYRTDLPLTPGSHNPCYPIFDRTHPNGINFMYARFSSDLRSIEDAAADPISGNQPVFVDPSDKLYISLSVFGPSSPQFKILDYSQPVPTGPTCIADTIHHNATSVAPGLLVSIYGPGIGPDQPAYGAPDTSGIISPLLSGTQVMFDDIPAPILYTSGSRIDTVVPFGVPTSGTTLVSVLKDGELVGTLTNALVPSSIRPFYVGDGGYGPLA
jgi:hypothetical protein